MTDHQQREITQAGPLLQADGSLAQVGWMRQPLLDCNLQAARFYNLKFLQPLRTKRWDYYGITTPTHFFSFTLSDIGYLNMVFAYVVDFVNKTHHEETLTLPLSKAVTLPRSSAAGVSSFSNKSASMVFTAEEGRRLVSVQWPKFEGSGLHADLVLLEPEGQESMTIVIPIEERRFYYNRKINCMPASGKITYQGRTFELTQDKALGNLDWGRGVWAYSSSWVWASCSGFLSDGRTIGLNLGYGFGDNSAATENAVILDGRVHKLGQVDFSYSSKDFMQAWHMHSPDGRLDLIFEPFYERVVRTDVKLLYSEVHQIFGRYSGQFTSDTGEKIMLDGLAGFAEEHHARW